MVFFSDGPYVVICFSKSNSSDIHIGELASFELCLFSSLEAALLSRAELTDSVSLLSAGEALSWARPLGLQLFVRNAGVMAELITSEPSRANLMYSLFLFPIQHNLGSLLCRLEMRVFGKSMRDINAVMLAEHKHLWSRGLAPW